MYQLLGCEFVGSSSQQRGGCRDEVMARNQPRLNSNFISLLTEVLFGLVYCNVQPIHQALLLICFIFDSILLDLDMLRPFVSFFQDGRAQGIQRGTIRGTIQLLH